MRSLKTFGSGMPTIEPSILRTALLVQRCMSTGVWNVTFTGSCSRVLRSLASASEAARDTSACGIMTTGSCFFFPNAIVVLLLVGTKVPIVLIPRITTTFVDYTELLVAGHFSLGEALEEFLELLSGEALPMRSLMTHYFGGHAATKALQSHQRDVPIAPDLSSLLRPPLRGVQVALRIPDAPGA